MGRASVTKPGRSATLVRMSSLPHAVPATPAAAMAPGLMVLLLAFGLSQLVWGPMSDRFGRRPVLLAGLAAYTAASIGCALAPSMALLIVWRTVQGAAMGAAVMCARAIVQDLYTPEAGALAWTFVQHHG